ncbi:TPA: GGDEF domain-containing protein, partial [Legionella pneumophila]
AMHHNIITLVLGGMASGALASLSIYLPAYYAYILSMFVPIILYNYWLGDIDHILLATMFFLFILMLMITAQFPCRLLRKTISLDKEKEEAFNEIKHLSITDSLTGLYNRRYFDQRLGEEINRAKRTNQSLVLMFIDVDDFKLINDQYGHPTGDLFLIELAKTMNSLVHRDEDACFRIGGDEFAALLTKSTLDTVMAQCKNLKEHLYRSGIDVKTSISIGIVSVSPTDLENVEQVISEADKTLYQAKKEGKNHVCCHNIPNRGKNNPPPEAHRL